MNQLGAAAYSAVATIAKMAGALVAVKGISILLGPEGLGQLGNFLNAIALATVLVSGGTSLGVTRYVAERQGSPDQISRLIQATSFASVACAGFLCVFGIVNATWLADLLLNDPAQSQAIMLASLLLPLLAYGAIGLAVVNGFGETRVLAWVQIGTAVAGASIALLCTWAWGIGGAAFGLAWLSSSHVIFLGLWWKNRSGLQWSYLSPVFHRSEFVLLAAYAWLFAVTTIGQNVVQFFIRSIIENRNGMLETGLWQAVSRMSDAHLQLFFVFCASSLLPQLARSKTKVEVSRVLGSSLRLLLCIAVLTVAVLIAFREWLLVILFSGDFAVARDYVIPQALGDFFRIISFASAYYLIARRHVKFILIGDAIQAAILLSLAYLLIGNNSAEGACWAYAFTYIIYLPVALSFLLYQLKREK